MGISHLRDLQGTRVSWDCPLGIPQEGVQDILPPSTPSADKTNISSGPGGILAACPAFSALQTPLEVVGESEQLTASYPYWITVKSRLLETLKASSAKTDSGVWGPA